MARTPVTDNNSVAAVLTQIADLLEIKGQNLFRVRSYRQAAEAIQLAPRPVAEMTTVEELQSIPGVGKGIGEKVLEIVQTGRSSQLAELQQELPPTLLDLLTVPGVGPRTVALVYQDLGIETVEQLEQAAREHKLRALPHMGAKSEEKILKGIETTRAYSGRFRQDQVLPLADALVEALRRRQEVALAEYAGSARRGAETIGDLDILACSDKPAKVMQYFVSLPQVAEVLLRGDTKTSVRADSNLQIDLRVVPADSFGAALQYFTGSQPHNVRLRTLAKAKGIRLNEYGVFVEATDERLGGQKEEDVYAALGLPLIPPQLRENAGELEAAQEGRLPRLIQANDIRGDLHVHTSDSDGTMALEQVVQTAIDLRYDYVCVTDHTKSLIVANGLDEKGLLAQQKRIAALNQRLEGKLRLLSGCEVNILSDGKTDIDQEVLLQLDLVTGSIHSGMDQPKEKITHRLLAAIENPAIKIIGHPTNRIIGRRAESPMDFETVFKAAAKHRTAMEINCWPERLDLRDVYLRQGREYQVRFCVCTDSHAREHMTTMMRYGLLTAQRGWLEPKHVLNTSPVKRLLAYFR